MLSFEHARVVCKTSAHWEVKIARRKQINTMGQIVGFFRHGHAEGPPTRLSGLDRIKFRTSAHSAEAMRLRKASTISGQVVGLVIFTISS